MTTLLYKFFELYRMAFSPHLFQRLKPAPRPATTAEVGPDQRTEKEQNTFMNLTVAMGTSVFIC